VTYHPLGTTGQGTGPLGNSFLPVIYVGIGGFIGAAMRYVASLATAGWSVVIPYGTLISNVIGCFVIGVVAALTADTEALSPNARLFLATGVCGGFTTMSSFVYELAQYVRSDEMLMAVVYLGLTLAGSILMFYAGTMLVTVARS
jgi:CrcB protein